MLNILVTHGEQPLDSESARILLDKMARKYDTNFDGKFSYAGLSNKRCILIKN